MITTNFIINNIYLILINILICTFSLIFIIWNQFSNNSKIFKKNNLLGFITSIFLGIIFSILNLINVFFYDVLKTTMIIIHFIPIIMIITYFLNIKISLTNIITFCIIYIIYYFVFLEKNNYLESKQFLFSMVLILLSTSVTYLFKFFNLKRFWQIVIFSLIIFVFSNIIIFFFFDKSKWLMMFIELLANQFIFISFMFFYKLFYKIIKNIVDLNHLSIYNNEFFLNWNSFLKIFKKFKQENNLFFVCSIDIKNIDNNLELNASNQKNILKKTIFDYLKLNLSSYKTVFFMDNFNNYNILISQTNKDIDEIKQELSKIFENIICNIVVNDKKIKIYLNYSFSIFGIHSYSIFELLKINNELFGLKNNINFFDPKKKLKITLFDNLNINPNEIKIFLINQINDFNVLEITLIYKNNFYKSIDEFLNCFKNELNEKEINILKRMIAYLAIVEYNKNDKFSNFYLLCEYPEDIFLQKNFNINYLVQKFEKLNFDYKKIIFNFKNNISFYSFDFIKNIQYLKEYNIKFILNINDDDLNILKIIKPSILKIKQKYYHITDDTFYESL